MDLSSKHVEERFAGLDRSTKNKASVGSLDDVEHPLILEGTFSL